MTQSKNPHIRRMENIAQKYGLEMSDFDRKIAEEKGTRVCAFCKQDAYFKPSVGTWVCECGALWATSRKAWAKIVRD